MMSDAKPAPLISIIWNARGRSAAALENVAALKAQNYHNFELLLIEDGEPAEGSRDLLEAAATDSRLRILPRTSSRSGESLLGALRQCRGDYIAICPTEGHFVPDALQFAVKAFAEHPGAGIICGEKFLVDAHDNELTDVDLVTLLFTSYRPFLPAGFFRRQALLEAGLEGEGWRKESLDLELCTRLAGDFGVRCFPRKVVDCKSAATQDDGLSKTAAGALEARLQLLSKIFSAEGFWGNDEPLLLESTVHQAAILWEQFLALGQSDIVPLAQRELTAVADRFDTLLKHDHRILHNLHRLFSTRSHRLGILSTPLQKWLAFSSRQTGRLAIHLPYQMWESRFGVGSWLKRKVIAQTLPHARYHEAAPTRQQMLADLYAIAASRHEAYGQVDVALAMWKLAEPLGSLDIDSLAVQGILRLPSATNETITAFQERWVRRHVGPAGPKTLKTPNLPGATGKIRIGYHCAFMHSDTVRYMMRNVLQAHDRTRFEIYGYSPRVVPPDIAQTFDVLRSTAAKQSPHSVLPMGAVPAIPTRDFVAMVRGDDIDVFVELTGFSMGHRFVDMASRCAPVQVSFLNHTGPSQVPNVDYILADHIGASDSDQPYYSETIYRLPSCFFCFDYRGYFAPPISPEPPSTGNGHTTFGAFGYGGKFNERMIEIWARLLHRVPHSVLHLQNSQMNDEDCRRFIAGKFHRYGIQRDRLVLAPGTSREKLLETYNQIDVSLDTWPYCGGNTIAESLWMGVPVVSLTGDRFSSRYGASLLAAAGCGDLVGETPEHYVEIASGLAADLPRLLLLRQNLRRMSIENGLGDSERFARDLENAYVEMLRRAAAVTP